MEYFQNQPKLFSSGNEIVDYARNFFGIDAEHFAALLGIHGAVHNGKFGAKYTWFGPGYISNVFFKMLANKPMYWMGKGGDLSFTSCTSSGGTKIPLYNLAVGDKNGEPLAYNGWYFI